MGVVLSFLWNNINAWECMATKVISNEVFIGILRSSTFVTLFSLKSRILRFWFGVTAYDWRSSSCVKGLFGCILFLETTFDESLSIMSWWMFLNSNAAKNNKACLMRQHALSIELEKISWIDTVSPLKTPSILDLVFQRLNCQHFTRLNRIYIQYC